MYDISPSEEQFQAALGVVSELCRMHGRTEEQEGLRRITQEVLELCYSIGGAYGEDDVRAVAQALILRGKL